MAMTGQSPLPRTCRHHQRATHTLKGREASFSGKCMHKKRPFFPHAFSLKGASAFFFMDCSIKIHTPVHKKICPKLDIQRWLLKPVFATSCKSACGPGFFRVSWIFQEHPAPRYNVGAPKCENMGPQFGASQDLDFRLDVFLGSFQKSCQNFSGFTGTLVVMPLGSKNQHCRGGRGLASRGIKSGSIFPMVFRVFWQKRRIMHTKHEGHQPNNVWGVALWPNLFVDQCPKNCPQGPPERLEFSWNHTKCENRRLTGDFEVFWVFWVSTKCLCFQFSGLNPPNP